MFLYIKRELSLLVVVVVVVDLFSKRENVDPLASISNVFQLQLEL